MTDRICATLITVLFTFWLLSVANKQQNIEKTAVYIDEYDIEIICSKQYIIDLNLTTLVNQDSLEMLAHLIYAEAGSDWCTDELQAYVGSVVLNRIKHESFPDNMYDVIHQPGQYGCIVDGNYNKVPNERAYCIAESLLLNGSVLPDNVVYQAGFKQGTGVHCIEQNIYFCYR